jgi:hypothetical protein
MDSRSRRIVWSAGTLILLLAADTQAQLFGLGGSAAPAPEPSVVSIVPPGVTLGEEAEWTVTGQNLSGISRWLISGEGLEIVGFEARGENTANVRVRASEDAQAGFRELRALGPGGLSNLSLVRVDELPQIAEREPNDSPEEAPIVRPGRAIAGTLGPQDLDHVRVEGRRGMSLNVEVEARRLGNPAIPVLSLLGPSGLSLAQASETRGLERDARLALTLPEDGLYTIRLHDKLYGGAEGAVYRLRIESGTPVATGLFPLGGRRGETITVEASGGTLDEPRTRSITLPDEPGRLLHVGEFDGPGGPVRVPMRLAVGGGTEVIEAPGDSMLTVEPGACINGRIDRPGEVDRYRLKVKKGESVSLRVRASALGSWLDSVVRVLDGEGRTLAQNDDSGVENGNMQFQPFNPQPPAPEDSRLTFEPKADGEVQIEVFDRFSHGGPEYAYRLEVGGAGPDFQIQLLFGDPNLTRRLAQAGQMQRAPRLPGANGALTLRPGSTSTIQFLVTGTGGLGTIEVRAEGLPLGVSAKPVQIQPPAFVGPNRPLPPSGGAIALTVDPKAGTDLSRVRIVATARPKDGPELTRVASATILLDAPNTAPAGVPALPVTRELEELTAWVAGDPRPASLRPDFVGPPEPIEITIREVENPGVVLQGGLADLSIRLEPALPPPGSYSVEALASGIGLGVQTLVTEQAASRQPDPKTSAATVRVLADTDAPPGTSDVRIVVQPFGRKSVERVERIEVRPPFQLRAAVDALEIGPGESTTLEVEVVREPGPGSREPIRLSLELPKGVEVEDPASLQIEPGQEKSQIRLRLSDGAEAPAEPVAIDLTGTIRMPRGRVSVAAKVRPMLSRRVAEK